MARNKKPFGLVVTAVYAAFSGVIIFLVGLLLLVAGQAPGTTGLLFTLAGLVCCVLGVVLCAAVFGLWSLLEWGRKTMFWLSVAFIPLGLISIFPIWPNQQITIGNTLLQLVGIAISVLIASYLSRAKVRVLFIPNRK